MFYEFSTAKLDNIR